MGDAVYVFTRILPGIKEIKHGLERTNHYRARQARRHTMRRMNKPEKS